jgi:hypothetical protein
VGIVNPLPVNFYWRDYFDGVAILTEQSTVAVNYEETFEEAFNFNLHFLQESIREHIDNAIGGDDADRENLNAIFPLALGKVIQHYQASNTNIPYSVLILAHDRNFEIVEVESIRHFKWAFYSLRPDSQLGSTPLPACFKEVIDTLIHEGIIYEHFLLSELTYVTELCAEYLSISEISLAVEMLAHAQKSYGAYRNCRLWDSRSQLGSFKKAGFKRETLLKLIYGMFTDGYKFNRKQSDSKKKLKIKAVNNAVHDHTHSIPLQVITGFLSEACRDNEPNFNGYCKAPIEQNMFPSQQDRAVMLLIILSMAIDKYDYKIDSLRNIATGENGIRAKIKTVLIEVDDDTIRKCLSEAKEILLAL